MSSVNKNVFLFIKISLIYIILASIKVAPLLCWEILQKYNLTDPYVFKSWQSLSLDYQC